MSFDIFTYGNPDAATQLVQMVDDHDLSLIEQEVEFIRELSGGQDFGLKAVKVNDWNKDLSPWAAPAVFGNEDFGDGAEETLKYVLEKVIPASEDTPSGTIKRIFIGGYSLAGLFSLWASYQTDLFDGIAAVSPSVWFPGWLDYAQNHHSQARSIYLSLGDKEEKTRNRTMAQVGEAIREQETILIRQGVNTILEWNVGNHFVDSEKRMAKGFAWLMNRQNEYDVSHKSWSD